MRYTYSSAGRVVVVQCGVWINSLAWPSPNAINPHTTQHNDHPTIYYYYYYYTDSSQWPGISSFTRFLDHTQRRTTIGVSTLHEWPARRRDLYLTDNTHHSQ